MSMQAFNGSLEPTFNPFDDNYLCEIIEATAAAWTRMKQPSKRELEDQITFRLAGRLANDPYFAELPYDIAPQSWLVGVDGERLGRLDLRFKHKQSQRDYFAFEAKRLHVTYPAGKFSTEYPTYVGSEGMMAFIEGQYSPALAAGGMLAYVMDADTNRAWGGLQGRIQASRDALKIQENSGLVPSMLSTAIAKGSNAARLGETKHNMDPYELRLLHLILPVRRDGE
jgi:hypothetical protein